MADDRPSNRPVSVDAELLRDLAAAYINGMSVRALAVERGWSYGTTHRVLQVAAHQGLMRMRPRGARPHAANNR